MKMTQFYSQYSEDRWLIENIELPSHGYFVEVGACDGITGSNTKHFEGTGQDGLCIEADPRNILGLVQNRKTVLWGVISDEEAIRELICNDNLQLTGLSNPAGLPEMTRFFVPTVRLQTALDRLDIKEIDLLSIDTEGTEIDVLNSFDMRNRSPHLVIVEYSTCGVDTKEQLRDFFRTCPRLKLVHQTSSNLIWSDGFYPRKPKHFKVIEIGICDFDILSENFDEAPCLLVEPHPYFCQKLRDQNRHNWIIEESAIDEKHGRYPFCYMPLDEIEKHDLDWWMRGASALDPVTLMKETCRTKRVEHLIRTIEVETMTLKDLFHKYFVTSMDILRVDAEGRDQFIMKDYIELVHENPAWKAQKIDFENTWFDSEERLIAVESGLRDLGYVVTRYESQTLAINKEHFEK